MHCMHGSEDHANIALTQELDPALEAVFRQLCTAVRHELDVRRQAGPVLDPAESGLASNYAAALLQTIQARRDAGTLSPAEFEYCLAAANEIFQLEMIFFDIQFSGMITQSAERPD